MSALPTEFLRSGPPPPRVVLLPDGLFFVRSIPVAATADASGVAAEAALVLEAASPFPLEQLYHGTFWVPGADKALVFAAYRRRITAEQTASWPQAELVIPAFAALLGAKLAPATTVVLASAAGLTAIHSDGGPVPSQVVFQPVEPEAPDEERSRSRDTLLRRFESKTVLEIAESPVPEPNRTDSEVVFRSGDFESRIPAAVAAAMDIRDKDELAGLRRARARDVVIWRVGLGCLAACALMLLGEIALLGGGLWQKARVLKVDAQAPVVENIKTAQSLATHINELSTKRLLPLEMISLISGPKPSSIQFRTASASTSPATGGLYTLTIEAETSNAAEIGLYQNALNALPACAKVEVREPRSRNSVATFTLVVTFKPLALKPAASSS